MKLDFGGYDGIVATWVFGASNAWNPLGWIALGVAATLTVVVIVVSISQTIHYYKEHTSNARKSTEQKHQYGDARRKRDQGGEKKKQKNMIFFKYSRSADGIKTFLPVSFWKMTGKNVRTHCIIFFDQTRD